MLGLCSLMLLGSKKSLQFVMLVKKFLNFIVTVVDSGHEKKSTSKEFLSSVHLV